MVKSVILNSIFTKQEADDLFSEAEDLEKKLFQPGRRIVFSPLMTETAKNLAVDLEIKSQLKEFLLLIKKELSEIPVFSLTTAALPSLKFLQKTCLWLRKELSQNIVIDINIDTNIIAGVIISFEGKYTDNSAKKKLDEWFINYKL